MNGLIYGDKTLVFLKEKLISNSNITHEDLNVYLEKGFPNLYKFLTATRIYNFADPRCNGLKSMVQQCVNCCDEMNRLVGNQALPVRCDEDAFVRNDDIPGMIDNPLSEVDELSRGTFIPGMREIRPFPNKYFSAGELRPIDMRSINHELTPPPEGETNDCKKKDKSSNTKSDFMPGLITISCVHGICLGILKKNYFFILLIIFIILFFKCRLLHNV